MKILITAGPTVEPIDPIRFISNYSTGAMGFAAAKQAKKQAHEVILISGPTDLKPPEGIKLIKVVTAAEMFEAVKKYFCRCDALIMAAAVCDFRPDKINQAKIKKKKIVILQLKENPDILNWCGRHKKNQILAGFALESKNLVKNAFKKLKDKNLDFIVANQVKKNFLPFGDKVTSAVIIDKKGHREYLNRVHKKSLAKVLIDKLDMAR